MEKSLFLPFVKAIMPKLALYIQERENNSKSPRTYLHKTMLKPVYSIDQKWEGSSANTIFAAADYVAMDSPLPLKSRSAISSSNGKLPKIGMKKPMKESELNAVKLMRAHLSQLTGDAAKQKKLQIINKIVDDEFACSVGIDEKNEATFLEGLSNGVVLVHGDPDEERTTGVGMRVSYGYFESNKFGVAEKGHISREDIENVITKADADGNALQFLMLAKSTYNAMRREKWAAQLVADNNNQSYTDPANLGVPSAAKFDAAFEDEFGLTFIKVDRTVIFETDGVRKAFKPWNENNLIYLTTDMVGSLVYSDLVEATNPVPGVEYKTLDSYKLIARYFTPEPYQEVTSGQALVLPVIESVDSIYMQNIDDAQEVDNEKEAADTNDEKITVWGKTYTKAAFVTALKKFANLNSTTDKAIIKAVNGLNDEDEAKLKAAVESAIVG